MSFTLKRKQIVLAGLAVALTAAVYVNWYYTKPVSENNGEITEQTTADPSQQVNLGDAQYVNSASVASEYFANAQLNRSQAQSESKQSLMAVIESEEADAENKAAAQAALENLSQNIVLQSEIETLIKAKTGGEVFVSLGDGAQVVLSQGTLDDNIAVQVKEIITSKTDITVEKITIIEAK